MYTQMQRRGRALSSGQTSLPRALIWGFYCLWKLSQANTVPYLFRAGFFWKRKDVISRQSAIMCDLARRHSPPLLLMVLHSAKKNERLIGLQMGNEWPRDWRLARLRHLFVWCPSSGLCSSPLLYFLSFWIKPLSGLLFLFSLIFLPEELQQSTNYFCSPGALKYSPGK